jgi:hypothetical protein
LATFETCGVELVRVFKTPTTPGGIMGHWLHFRVVRPRGKLFRESHGIGEDFVTIGRKRGARRHFVAA